MITGFVKSIRWIACTAVALGGVQVVGQEHPISVPTAAFQVAAVPGTSAVPQPPHTGEATMSETFDLAPGEQLLKAEPVPGLENSAIPVYQAGAGCNSCSHCKGGGMLGYNFCDCNAGCNQNGYGFAEVLYFKRDRDDGFTLSLNGVLDEFDFELGTRITVGEFVDCFDAVEFVYTGMLEWNNQFVLNDPAGNLNALPLTIVAPLVAADFDTFFNATNQSHFFEASYDSFEINQRTWGWDVISILWGARYINYQEDFVYASTGSPAGNGFASQEIENHLIGGQIGGDIHEPVSLRGTVGLRGRAGLFWLHANGDTLVVNNGVAVINNSADEDSLVGLIELGIVARYQLTRNWKVNAGLEYWYMEGMVTVPSELRNPVLSPALSRNLDSNEDLSFYGATAGIEYWY